jgi:hypothetical protein
MAPVKRQTMLFSATMTEEVRKLVALSLNYPVRWAHPPAASAAARRRRHMQGPESPPAGRPIPCVRGGML